MAPKPNDFQDFIHNARERKKNEDLATKIFSSAKSRRQSAPSNLKTAVGGSLASRVGVKKQRASLDTRAAGNINGEWTHDLHNPKASKSQNRSLSSRISGPGITKPTPLSSSLTAPGSLSTATTSATRRQRQNARRAAALDRMDVDPVLQSQANVQSAPKGMTIRGLAGPFAVMAQNFAPGTTAADVESAMTPIGGEMESCRIVKSKPFIMVEMLFASREGGERVIETFNDKTADGRVLKVYPKIGGQATSTTPRSTRNNTNDQVVDGSLGFPDPSTKGQLYSDRLVTGNGQTKRGRGGQRGRGGR